MEQAEALKREIVEIVRREYRLGMVNLFEGNVSARLGERIFMTPSQVSKERLTADMLLELDPQGRIVHQGAGCAPSSEAAMHLEVYRLRPDVKAVVHNHSLYATVWAMQGLPLESDALTEMNVAFGTVPVAPYGTPGTARIYAGFAELLPNRYALLLANHGVLTFGSGLEAAFSYAEAVEKIAQTLYLARQLGPGAPLPAGELAALRRQGEEKRAAEIQRALEEA